MPFLFHSLFKNSIDSLFEPNHTSSEIKKRWWIIVKEFKNYTPNHLLNLLKLLEKSKIGKKSKVLDHGCGAGLTLFLVDSNSAGIKKIKLIKSGKNREWGINLSSHEYWEKLDIWISPTPNGERSKKRIFSLENLSSGEYLVHKDHGVCKFGGLKTISVNGKKKEFMRLFFHGNDEILVPVILLNRVQRYIGPKIKKLDK